MGEKILIERLSELEHEQWKVWAAVLMKFETLSEDRIKRWEKLFCSYSELTEDEKGHSRVWARKVLDILKELKDEANN
mgnify:CR=1 FL=1